MSGISGGTVSEESIREMTEDIGGLAEESTCIHADADGGIGISYPVEDEKGATTWTDGKKSGVVYGAITNLSELGLSHAEVFESLLERPGETAASLEGGFLAVCRDRSEEKYVVVTDKLGSRLPFYTTSGSFRFATSVSAILEQMDGGQLDLQAVSDMLLMGHLWGDRTLIKEITAVRPSHVLEFSDGTVSTHRYWVPDYEEHEPGEAYLSELVKRYRRAVQRGQKTFSGDAGLWLSGGLDSRSTAAALAEVRGESAITAYTYDANPPVGINPELAAEVAAELGFDHREIPLNAETFNDALERSIEAVDGMIAWNDLQNITTTYGVEQSPPVMMEGMQGELLGDHLLRPHVDKYASAVGSQFASEASATTEEVERVLSPDVDPMVTFRNEAETSPPSSIKGKIKDIHIQNYYSRRTLASNKIIRDVSGERTLHADGEYIEWCAKLPHSYRKGAITWGNTDIPFETTRAKLGLIRRLSPPLAEITYERTRLKPTLPYHAHVLGFFSSVAFERMVSKPTYGGGQLTDLWIRDRDSEIHETISGLIDDARNRPLFEGNAVTELFESHMNGSNGSGMLARITTLELWLQNNFD
ncbi:hypothetical protein DJ74_17560 [Halorubrum sp. Ea8]|nr:hypothetical protein DJ74_17560 [Halorubrum sp. Ea8]